MLLGSTPIRIDLNVGNVNQIQFGIVGVLAWLLRDQSSFSQYVGKHPSGNRDRLFERHTAAGIRLGLCLAFKPILLWMPSDCLLVPVVDGFHPQSGSGPELSVAVEPHPQIGDMSCPPRFGISS